MQEIKKRRIVLASVLKPADEPRMYERMGQSLADNGYEVFIVGSTPSSDWATNGILFLAHQMPSRLSLQRIILRYKILKKIFKVRPEILIVTTHELLGAAILYRLLTGKKIIYDVQEDYFKNILYTDAFPKAIKHSIAFFVRLKEIAASFFISRFILAERCYVHEIRFSKNKSIIIENKFRLPQNYTRMPLPETVQLLFSGTLAESTGVFQAIDLTKKLHSLNSKIKLTIIGYCALPQTLELIKKDIANFSFIQLIGGDKFVPHPEIVKRIAQANFGLICYPPSPHLENKIPTKLYEYMSCQLPIIVQDHELWKKTCAPYNAAIPVNFEKPNIHELITQMSRQAFYTSSPDNTTWQSEEKKFVNVIHTFIE
ncbi:MAG: glycosyltransferase [Bacteroidetes bacterium]|nr:glycosyltransferase [Bacteroidota bacterium]